MPAPHTTAALAVAPVLIAPRPLLAQSKLAASYTILVAGIPIGSGTSRVDIADTTVTMTGKARGALRP